MKKMTMLLVVALALVLGCKKKVQPDMGGAQNACDCLKEQRSSFFMGEIYGEQYIDLDTVIMPIYYSDGNPANYQYINYTYITFKSNNPNALSYEWQVGSNSTSQTVREFSLYFLDSLDQLPVRLITKSKPNTKCIPNDDGIDTIIRYLNIKNMLPNPMWGKYYGYSSEAPNDYFTIEIDTAQFPITVVGDSSLAEVVYNLPNGKHKPFAFGRELGSASYCFVGAGDNLPPYNDLFYVGDKSLDFSNQCRAYYNRFTKEIEIIYFTREIIDQYYLSNTYTRKVFKGKKI